MIICRSFIAFVCLLNAELPKLALALFFLVCMNVVWICILLIQDFRLCSGYLVLTLVQSGLVCVNCLYVSLMKESATHYVMLSGVLKEVLVFDNHSSAALCL